jgi:hypothetical protein
MKGNRIIWALAAAAVAVAALGYAARTRHPAASDRLPELVEMAPTDATVVAYADLRALRSSPLIERLTTMARPVRADRDYANFVSATGFDYRRDLDRVVLAVRPNGATYDTLVFAEGRFDREKIAEYALRSGKLRQENGQQVYVMPSTTPGKKISLEFLGGDRLALSDGGNLASALAARGHARLDPAMRERLSRVAGSPLFAAVNVPAFAGKAAGGAAAGESTMELFRSLRWVSLAARPDGDEIYLSAEGECGNAAEARNVAGALDLMRTLLRGGLADPKARGRISAEDATAASRLLGAMRIANEAERVRVLLAVNSEMLRVPQASTPASP